MVVTKIVLYSLTVIFDLTGVCVTIILFLTMLCRRSIVKTDRVSYLLLANSYIAYLVASPFFAEMSLNSIYGQLHPNSSFNVKSCVFKSYIIYVSGCVYFHSYLLQAIYRLCRIVYATRLQYQSFRIYAILSIGQWVLAALMLLPSLLAGSIEYIPTEHHCQIAATNLLGSLLGLSFLFLIPFVSTLILYFYTIHYVHTKTTALHAINHHTSIRRDLIILSRLIILFTFISTVALPHVLMPIFYVLTNYLPVWISALEWLFTCFSLNTACIIQIFSVPQLRKLWLPAIRIQPVEAIGHAIKP
ncbi:unnamed protein product [Adineta steineri]|uniref:G-protein coupled receptors family 1 profile domain-containing protein n=1 Tax=Adineta steineri TaxID=433720 RepID=A0A813ZCF0_9BILA|nr:unnamed protein product [Adineta steineri]CAF3737150.1 unnamed protein product [Adineta steineri]